MNEQQLVEGPMPNWWIAGIQVVVHWTALFALAVIMGVIVPRFAQTFIEFDLSLPASTVLVVNLSNFFVAYGWLLFLPFLLFDAALLLVPRALGPTGGTLASIWFVIGLLAVIALAIITLVSLIVPHMALIEGLA